MARHNSAENIIDFQSRRNWVNPMSLKFSWKYEEDIDWGEKKRKNCIKRARFLKASSRE